MWKKIKHFILFSAATLFLIGLVLGFFLVKWISDLPVPDFETFEERKVVQSTKIFDKTGENLLYDVHENIKRTVIPYEDLPRHIKNATVAIEDSNFYHHGGFQLKSYIRAFWVNLGAGEIQQGGSTITQQLVKNTFLTFEQTYTRKMKELILSLKMEKVFTKEEILTLYLNEIPYGGSNYGIEAAANSFFGKSTKDLTLTESAYLAALPQAPSYYSPYGLHKDELDQRKDLVLSKMLELNFITEEEYNQALNEEVSFLSQSEKGIRAPHFVMYIKSYLEEKYGKDVIEQGGLKITTTLDLNLQEEAEKMIKEYVKEIEEKFNASNAGIIGMDPKTGQILIMVGSRDYFDKENEGNFNTTLAKRQPGSAFKPFVYATALEKGYTPETIVFDLKTEFNASCNPDSTPKGGIDEKDCYSPGNYDNIFRGPVSLREALAQSINIPAVKTLYLAGLNDSLNTAKKMGITSLDNPLRYGLTLVLGGGEVSLLDITSAYSVFATGGVKNNPTGILKIEDNKGNILEEYVYQPKTVLGTEVAYTINDILSDNEARTPAFGERSWLYFEDRQVAVKTGTTNDYRDAWVIGYTPNFSLGLWVGNNNNASMEKRVAGFIAAPLWNQFFIKVFETLPKEDFIKKEKNISENLKPVLKGSWEGGNSYFVDKISKKLATEFTPKELIEEKVLKQIHSILYWVDKKNPLGEKPENPGNDPQFILWETPVRNWVSNQNIKEETEDSVPKEYDDVHKPEYIPMINIISPSPNQTFDKNSIITVKIETLTHFFPLKQVDFYLENIYVGSLSSPRPQYNGGQKPFYEFVFRPDTLDPIKDIYKMKLIIYDSVKNKNEYTIPIVIR